jgi:hypothetical protein
MRSFASSFALIRILHHAAGTPLDTPQLRERLSAKGASLDNQSLNRALSRLRRHGWLKTKNSGHSLTPAGRKALKLATAGLKNLARLTGRPIRTADV